MPDPRPIVPKPNRAARKAPADLLATEIAAGQDGVSRDLALIMGGVSYSAFTDLPVPLFLRLRNLAMMLLFFDYDATAQAARLKVTLRERDELAEHPALERVKAAVASSGQMVAGLSTLDDVAKHVEVGVGKDLAVLSARAPNIRERLKAQEAIADRRSPKRGRNEAKKSARVFPEELLQVLEYGRRLQLEIDAASAGGGKGGDVVDAEILNVPKAKRKQLTDGGSAAGNGEGGVQ